MDAIRAGSVGQQPPAGPVPALAREGDWLTRILPYHRIVVGVDGSAASRAAVRWALREAQLRRANLHLVCAWGDDERLRAPYAPWPRGTGPEGGCASASTALAAAAADARRQLPPGRLATELVRGLASRVLLDRAAAAELLVLGSDRPARQPGQPAPALGQVARTCLRVAPCPVVIVTPDYQIAGCGHSRPRVMSAGAGRTR